MIEWKPLQDKYSEGKFPGGRAFVKMRSEKGKLVADSVYLVQGPEKLKLVASDHGLITLQDAQTLAELHHLSFSSKN